MKFLIQVCITACALLLASRIVPGFSIDSLTTAIAVACAMGVLNAVVRPVLILLTLPISIVTLGLFIFIVNASLLLFVASFIQGFTITHFSSALIGSLGISLISSIANRYM